MKQEVRFNPYLDYNEKNFGLLKLRARYPKETEDQICDRLFGRRK